MTWRRRERSEAEEKYSQKEEVKEKKEVKRRGHFKTRLFSVPCHHVNLSVV